MVHKQLTPEWKLWIWSNVVNGFDRESIFNILLNNGFDYNLVKSELEMEPTNGMIWSRQYSQDDLNKPYEVELYPFHKNLCDDARSFKIESNFVEMYLIPDFLSEEECNSLINTLTVKKGKKSIVSSTLDTTTEIYSKIDNKINARMLIDSDLGETMNIKKYELNETEEEHYDFFSVHDENSEAKLGDKGQRNWSFFVYLNNVEEGGVLTFKNMNKQIKPIKGMAVVWKNVYHDGTENPYTKHYVSPVMNGESYILEKFFRMGNPEQVANDIQIIELNTNE